MGWTSYLPTHYKNGRVDRKAEIDEKYTQKEGLSSYGYLCGLRVLKSQMVGSVYYGAIEVTDSRKDSVSKEVVGVVVLTSCSNGEFYYKEIDETMGPAENKCPMSILKLLTPTQSDYAKEWRKRCEEYNNAKKVANVSNLPIGTIISFPWGFDGEQMRIKKMSPQYQFKTPWWLIIGENKYFKKCNIPQNFVIEEMGRDNQ